MSRRKSCIPVFIKKKNNNNNNEKRRILPKFEKNRDKFSSVKEQAFNFMWDGINCKKGGKYFADK
jgi:hypothetical protein